MKKKIFGTDGVRGPANSFPVTAETALKLGISVGTFFRSKAGTNRVILGKDTRRSSYMLESALTAGFTSVGMDVFLLGPVPTPAIGFLTKSMRADLGVMISASHNPFYDNGIKFFGPNGYKLSDKSELEIENLFHSKLELSNPSLIGKASRINDGLGRYTEVAKTSLPTHLRLDGLKIVIDCANGSSYKVAPEILWELGAEVICLGNNPNGYNINLGCGSTEPLIAANLVKKESADLGICLDGDGDRIILIDEKGTIANGDILMGLLAHNWKNKGTLKGEGLVCTIMSNIALEHYLRSIGLKVFRTKVGDRYVAEKMKEKNCNLGGEQSGHIIMSDYFTTGDGLTAGLQFLTSIVETGTKASDLFKVFKPFPQILSNIKINDNDDVLKNKKVKDSILNVENEIGDNGRIIVRKSGTEPLIRVMVEHQDKKIAQKVSSFLTSLIENQ